MAKFKYKDIDKEIAAVLKNHVKQFGYKKIDCYAYKKHKDYFISICFDSGWRFLSCIDTDEYLADANNSSVCSLDTIVQIEPAILAVINLPVGTDVTLTIVDGERVFVDTN